MIQVLQTIADNIQATSQPGWVEYLAIGISFVSMAISGMAIWFAIRVADKQNKVSLFEKRLDCYILVQKLIACAEQIKECKKNHEVQMSLRLYLDTTRNIEYDKSLAEFICTLKHLEPIILTGEFLFEKYNTPLLQEIINVSIDLVCAVAISNSNEKNEWLSNEAIDLKRKYCALCAEYDENYVEFMENDLILAQPYRR